MPTERQLRFTAADVELFAAASGDRNPLHGDTEFAAATAFGEPIAHGALLAIAMLGTLPAQAQARVRSLQASFSGAVPVDSQTTVAADPLAREAGAWELSLSARGRTLARVLARPQAQLPATPPFPPAAGSAASPMRTTPAEPDASELKAGHALSGRYTAAGEQLSEIARRFGAGALDRRLLEGLAWGSYAVGMELPGLHSLLAGLAIELDAGHETAQSPAGGEQTLTVASHDERTGQLTLQGTLATPALGGGRVLARIQCFALPRPASPDPEAAGLGSPAAPPRGAVAIAGASRGYGASLALALLAQGYECHVAYRSSHSYAQQLAQLAGKHACRLHIRQADLRDPAAVQSWADEVQAQSGSLAGLALCAALPPLAMGVSPASARELSGYVARSLELVATPLGALLELLDEEGWTLFCSSSALQSPPRDWPHYVSAKGAIEGLAAWAAASRPSLRTAVVRLPKMATAMTGTPTGRIGAASADAVARWTAQQLASEELPAGLTQLVPPASLEALSGHRVLEASAA